MNNPRRAIKSWSQLLGLCPLLVIDLGIVDALIFGIALLVTLLFTNTAMALSQRWLAEQQRLVATALLAALSTGIVDLVLQAICYQQAQALQLYLPLIVVAPLLFYKAEPVYKTDNGEPRSLSRVLIDTLFCGSAFVCGLVITALLRAPLPSEIAIPFGLICGALLLAPANMAVPLRRQIAPPSEPRTRARVTGPVR